MASETWNFDLAKADTAMTELLQAFEAHPRMQPPSPHPTFFFLYDFVRNTHKQLKDIDVEKHTSGDKAARDQASEVYGRNNFANILVNDTTGKLALLTGGDPSNPVDFGDDIRSKAKALSDV